MGTRGSCFPTHAGRWLAPGCLALLGACGGAVGDPAARPTGGDAARLSGDAVLLAPVDDVQDGVVVKGVRFDGDAAQLQDADGSRLRPEDVDLGMVVKVDGRIEGEGMSGAARRIEVRPALQGPVEASDASGFTALGTRVRIDASTVMDGLQATTELRAGDPVRVHGLPAADGSLLATRVERASQAVGTFFLRGTLRGLDPASRRFTLGGQLVDYAAASTSGALVDGAAVLVRTDRPPQGGVLRATSVVRETGTVFPDEAIAGIEGFVTDFLSVANFRVAGVPVDATNAAVGGTAGSLRDGTRVTVRGVWRAGRLLASSVGFIDPGASRTIVSIGPVLGTPFWWGPAYWGSGWVPWFGSGVFVGGGLVGRLPAYGRTVWLDQPLTVLPGTVVRPGFGMPGRIGGGSFGSGGFGGTSPGMGFGGSGGAAPIGDAPFFGRPTPVFGTPSRPSGGSSGFGRQGSGRQGGRR